MVTIVVSDELRSQSPDDGSGVVVAVVVGVSSGVDTAVVVVDRGERGGRRLSMGVAGTTIKDGEGINPEKEREG